MTDPRGTRRWKELAARIIARDGVCSVCGTDQDLSVDHVIPISRNGAVWDEQNLITMCMTHNRQKSNKMVGQTTDYWNPVWLAWEANKLKESK